MQKRSSLFGAALTSLILLGATPAGAIQKTQVNDSWSLDLGGGWFQPQDEVFERRFEHDAYLKLGVNYKFGSRLILGLQYRFIHNDLDLDYISSLKEGFDWPEYKPSEVESENHWLGVKVGYDLVERSAAEISFSGLLYFVRVDVTEHRPFTYDHKYYSGSSGDPGGYKYHGTGLGLGGGFLFAYAVSKAIAVGLEVEYNAAALDYSNPGPWDPTPSTLQATLGPLYGFEDVGGFWLGPFIRIRF